MAYNEKLFRDTVAAIEAHPDHFDMSSWVQSDNCGTSYCFAGWALVVLHGPAPKDFNDDYAWWEAKPINFGCQSSFEAPAREALGLSVEEGDRLFYAALDPHSVDALKARITEVTGITFDVDAAGA